MNPAWRYVTEYFRADCAVTPMRDSRVTLFVWRFGQSADALRTPLGFVLRRLASVLDTVWTRAYIGAELPRRAVAGPGVRLTHGGRGVVIHPDTVIGSGAVIYHRTTIGVRDEGRPPIIGDDVFFGANCTVLGPITIGDGCIVGAGTVVIRDMEPGEMAVGAATRYLPPKTRTRRP
jgi:serine O-acetyltransferase